MKEHFEHILNFIFILVMLFSIGITFTVISSHYKVLALFYGIIIIYGGINFFTTIKDIHQQDLNNMSYNYSEIIKKRKKKDDK